MPKKVFFREELTDLLSLHTSCLGDDYHVDPHSHRRLEISCVKSGAGRYIVEDRSYDLCPYDVFLFNNTERHCIRVDKGSQILNMVIEFEPEFLWGNIVSGIDYGFLQIFFERNAKFENRLDRQNPTTRRIYDLLLDIEREFTQKTEAYDLMVKIKLQSVFVEILRNYDYVAKSSVENIAMSKDAGAMKKVIGYIREHLCEDIKLNDLANVALMSPSYFSTSFKIFNGLSPFEYISQARVARAIEYIRSTDKSMTEIATLCGFNNSTNFIKNFKKVTRRTPSDYRS